MKIDLDRISSFFGKNKNPKVKVEPPKNRHYERVASRYSMLSVVTVALTVLVILINFALNKEMFTYRNLFYMIKDINLSGGSAEREYVPVTYAGGNNQHFAVYKNGLFVGSDSSVSVFTAAGKQGYSGNCSMQNSNVAASDSYAILYEQGGYNFSVYNSAAFLYSEKCDYPISMATASDSGRFAILSGSEKYRSQIKVYDRNFNNISIYSKNKYVFSMALDSDGENIAMLASYVSSGVNMTEVSLCRIGSDEYTYTLSIPDTFPLECVFSDRGELIVITTDGIYVISRSGEISSSYTYRGQTLSKFDTTGERTLLAFCEDPVERRYALLLFDVSGELIGRRDVKLDCDDVKVYGELAYVMSPDRVTRINMTSGEMTSVEYNCVGKTMLICDDGAILICSALGATYLIF